jgi:outer membrane protein OmpA-like peptidoglycan-associated protein
MSSFSKPRVSLTAVLCLASTTLAGWPQLANAANGRAPSADEGASGQAQISADTAQLSAETPASEPAGGAAAQTDTQASADAQKTPWIRRYKPQRNLFEIGVFGGFLRVNDEHELFEPKASDAQGGFRELNKFSPEFGLRLGYLPLTFLGIEAEGALLPTGLRSGGENALLWTGRGHLILQLPVASIVPFVVAGGGVLGVNSGANALGKDSDQAVHFGGGIKIYPTKRLAIRADVRDVLTTSRGLPNKLDSHNFEATLGVSLVLGRKDPVAAPPPPSDRDGDGIVDDADRCPDEPETVNGFEDEDGCPESDRDGDGFYDTPDQDKCPDVPGVAPDGCPSDRDGDRIYDNVDKCPDDPETYNNYEDEDGCPDQLPAPVAAFSGFIPGIRFDFDSAQLRPDMLETLDRAADTLKQYTDVRVDIYGHTDAKGTESYNDKLGHNRAQAVVDYLIGKGVDASRLQAHSAGKREPVGPNDNDEGRAQNRRIEFRISSQPAATTGNDGAPAPSEVKVAPTPPATTEPTSN